MAFGELSSDTSAIQSERDIANQALSKATESNGKLNLGQTQGHHLISINIFKNSDGLNKPEDKKLKEFMNFLEGQAIRRSPGRSGHAGCCLLSAVKSTSSPPGAHLLKRRNRVMGLSQCLIFSGPVMLLEE